MLTTFIRGDDLKIRELNFHYGHAKRMLTTMVGVEGRKSSSISTSMRFASGVWVSLLTPTSQSPVDGGSKSTAVVVSTPSSGCDVQAEASDWTTPLPRYRSTS